MGKDKMIHAADIRLKKRKCPHGAGGTHGESAVHAVPILM